MSDSAETVQTTSGPPPHADHRHELLLRMYDQMFNDINRHIMTVWQSVTTLAGTAALLALVETQIIPLDVAVTLIVIVCGWLLANCYDSSYWYNRNLVIIANIERQFLGAADLRQIHYYFGQHRANMKMLTHLRIQQILGLTILGLTLIVHAGVRFMAPDAAGRRSGWALELMPYVVTALTVWMVLWLRADRRNAYAAFLRNSPGLDVDTVGISYGSGHPV